VLLDEFHLKAACIGNGHGHIYVRGFAAVAAFGKLHMLDDEKRPDAEVLGPVPRRFAPVADDETVLHYATHSLHQLAR
jgi:hypothetical protein